MPFDVRLHYLPINSKRTWSMDGPSWLDRANVAESKPLIHEYWCDATYDRARYLITSAAELKQWHRQVYPPDSDRAQISDYAKKNVMTFEKEMGQAEDSDVYVMHWYEWEFGMN